MKKYRQIILLCTLFAFVTTACKKEEELPTKPAPQWAVDANSGYYVTMTAVVKIPENLSPYADKNDQLAAFIGNECRGIGVAKNGLFLVPIKGSPEEQGAIHFSYYSARNKYLYKTNSIGTFEVDKMYGTVDNPIKLSLEIIK